MYALKRRHLSIINETSIVLQAHLCSAWIDGQYKRTRNIETVKSAYEDLLRRLRTDYIDVGMIHYLDEQKDFDEVFGGSVIKYARELKAAGTIRHIGNASLPKPTSLTFKPVLPNIL